MTIEHAFHFPPPERGRVVAEGDLVGVRARALTPIRLALLAGLPLSGGGAKKRMDWSDA
jgi:hypothetical protein